MFDTSVSVLKLVPGMRLSQFQSSPELMQEQQQLQKAVQQYRHIRRQEVIRSSVSTSHKICVYSDRNPVDVCASLLREISTHTPTHKRTYMTCVRMLCYMHIDTCNGPKSAYTDLAAVASVV